MIAIPQKRHDKPTRLSTYLGHREPRNTYTYLSASPELLALAAARLEDKEIS